MSGTYPEGVQIPKTALLNAALKYAWHIEPSIAHPQVQVSRPLISSKHLMSRG